MIPVLIIIVVCALTPVVAALVERRMVWPYSEPQPVNEANITDIYINQQICEARALQFRMLGLSNDLKGPRYKIDYYFMVSPTGDTLAIIGKGSIMKIPLKGIWLYSIGPDDTGFYSVNQQSCVEFDASGKWKDQIVFNAGFDKLYRAHLAWLKKRNADITTFNEGREFVDFRQARSSRIELMRRMGLVRWTEANPEYWKYSVKGAFKCGLGTYFIGLFRHLKAGKG